MFKFGINNFRGFLNQELTFSKLNILIGENSSGKSSIFKFFLMLKQSLRNPRETNLTLRGPRVDLGSYKEIINNHKTEKNLEFYFEWGADYEGYYRDHIHAMQEIADPGGKASSVKGFIKDIVGRVQSHSTKIRFIISEELSKSESVSVEITNPGLGSLRIKRKKVIRKEIWSHPSCDLIYTPRGSRKGISLQKLDYDRHAFLSLIYAEDVGVGCKKVDNTGKLFYEVAFLLLAQNYLQDFLEKIEYINPLDSTPERIYLDEDKKGLRPVQNIKDVVGVLTDETIKVDSRKFLLKELKKLLKESGLAKDIKLIRGSNLLATELRVKIWNGNIWSNIKDVGHGLSLQIPVLFQVLLSRIQPKGEIVLIEQPEIHIHPSLQARFMDILALVGGPSSYFIETHSEHFVRKLQVIIKYKLYDVGSDYVSVHYFKAGTDRSHVTRHAISDEGNIVPPFPEGFYDSSYNLVKQLMFQ